MYSFLQSHKAMLLLAAIVIPSSITVRGMVATIDNLSTSQCSSDQPHKDMAAAVGESDLPADSEVDCKVGPWMNGACSVSCGAGRMKWERSVVQPASAKGKECPPLLYSEPCLLAPCPCMGSWQEWGPCQSNCSKRRQFHTTPGDVKGAPCSEKHGAVQTAVCEDGACAIDCKVGGWQPSGDCSQPCHGGKQRFIRDVQVERKGRGIACPPLEEFRPCNTQPCKFEAAMVGINNALSNFSADEPVMDIISQEYENFRGLVKCPASSVTDQQNLDWSTFVDQVRDTSKDYRSGERALLTALIRLMNFAKSAPNDLQAVFQFMFDGLMGHAERRLASFRSKFDDIYSAFKKVDKLFIGVEEAVKEYRDTAADRTAELSEDLRFIKSLGAATDLTEVHGFAKTIHVDHRGNDISCGAYNTLGELVLACQHDSRCVGMSSRDGRPWCLKHTLHAAGPVSDPTHIFYTKTLGLSPKAPTSVAAVNQYLNRWSSAWIGMKAVEEAVRKVTKKVMYISEQLGLMQAACDEMAGVLSSNSGARARVEELIADISNTFLDVVKYIKPHV